MDVSFISGNDKFNYRVCAMIISDGKILAMHDDRSPYYYLPGGRVILGETAEYAVIREVQEELGVTPKIVRPLWLNQAFFTEDVDNLYYHEICIYFLMDITDTDLLARGKQFTSNEGHRTHTFEWLEFDRLKDEYFYPIPYNAKLMQENKTNLSFGEDFQFIACKGADEAAEIVRRIYLDEIAKNGMDQVQILTPYRKRSAAGVDELNKSLEDFVNPPIAGKKELHIGSQVFRVGDKILQNKNTEMASNGDLGRILDCITDEDGNARAVIGFPDGRQVQYEADQMEMIEHANATTIHKAQGSECPVVIIPWVKAFYMMLKRNILYTGVTRAKSKVYLVGEWAAVCQAIHTDDSGTRNTILSERIVQYYDQYQSEQKPEMEQLKLVV